MSLVFSLFLMLLPAPSVAQTSEPAVQRVRVGGRGVWGPSNYRGRSGFAQYGDRWKLRASYSDFTVDGSTDATRTYSARLAYQGDALSLGANASVTPRANHYTARSAGADAGWAFLSEDEDALLEEWELSGWWTRTAHTQGIPPHPVRGGQPDQRTNQDDYGGGLSVTALSMTASFDGYASFYDKAITRAAQFARNRPPLAGISSLLDSFPENGLSARLDYERWSFLIPFVGWSRTDYATGSPPAFTYSAGLAASWRALRFDYSYDLVRQRGSPASGYHSAGGSVRF